MQIKFGQNINEMILFQLFLNLKESVLAIFFTVFICVSTNAQVTIWSENFSTNANNDLVGNDNNLPIGADWTTSCPTCNRVNEFRVEGNRFRVENTDEIATWTSELISITGFTGVGSNISIDMNDNDFDATDCITISYRLDGGAKTTFPINGNLCDDGADPTFASVSGLSGTTFQIIIDAITTNTNEDMHFDNITVTGFIPLGLMGPGGVGKVDGTGQLSLWLNANNIGQADGSNLTTWVDQSGYGNTANAVVGNEPVFRSNILNSYPVVRFEEANVDYLRVQDANSLRPNNISVFVVGSYTNLSASWAPFVLKTTTWAWDDGYGIARWNAQGNIEGFVTDYNTNFVSSAVNFNTPSILTLEYDNSDVQTFFDEVLQGTDNFTPNINNSNNFLYLGITPTVAGTGVTNSLDGDIAEVIIFSQAINDAQRIIVHNYLAAKYELFLGVNDVYNEDIVGAGNYDHEVAGIGRVNATNIHDDAQGSGMVRILNPTGLGNDEFMMWGHDNGVAEATNIIDIPATVQGRFDRVWRVSEVNTAGNARDVGNVDMRWDLTGLGVVISSDLRLLVDTDNDGVFIDETPIAGALSLGNNIYEFPSVSAITNNRRFTIATINKLTTPLPIDLVSFEANVKGDKVDLKWITASELNNDYFTIERSEDALTWEEVMVVAGAGNSNQTITYFDSDYEPLTDISYYRLKQTDFNGQISYSNIVPVKFIEDHVIGNINLFPSPLQPGHLLSVSFVHIVESELLVVLRDIQGKEYYSKIVVEIKNGKLIGIPIGTNIPSGVYLITASSENQIYSQKLIIK